MQKTRLIDFICRHWERRSHQAVHSVQTSAGNTTESFSAQSRQKGQADHVFIINMRSAAFVLHVDLVTPERRTAEKCSRRFMLICHAGETLPLSSGNKITLRFTANGTETAKGFHFVYQGKHSFYLFIYLLPLCSWTFWSWFSQAMAFSSFWKNRFVFAAHLWHKRAFSGTQLAVVVHGRGRGAEWLMSCGEISLSFAVFSLHLLCLAVSLKPPFPHLTQPATCPRLFVSSCLLVLPCPSSSSLLTHSRPQDERHSVQLGPGAQVWKAHRERLWRGHGGAVWMQSRLHAARLHCHQVRGRAQRPGPVERHRAHMCR